MGESYADFTNRNRNRKNAISSSSIIVEKGHSRDFLTFVELLRPLALHTSVFRINLLSAVHNILELT